MVAQVSLENFADVVVDKVEKLTVKRFAKLKPALSKAIGEETEKYFTQVADKAIGVTHNPYKQYSRGYWEPLSKAYVRRKGHNKFWLHKGVLESYLRSASPAAVYGHPYVDIRDFNPTAHGYQNMTILVKPFPYKNPRFPVHIYNRLFGKRRVSSLAAKVMQSNEDMRPIMSPQMQILIRNNVKRRMNKVIKEVLNGDR